MSERKYWAKKHRSKSKALDDIHYLDKDIVKMLKETKVCLCCGTPLTTKFFYKGYCCKTCYNEKPYKYAYAEYVYEKPIKELIIEWLNENNSVQITADFIGVAKPSLYKYLKKHNISSITLWKEGVNNDNTQKTYEDNTINYESVKERCTQELSLYHHK